jgi:hypothetical protein
MTRSDLSARMLAIGLILCASSAAAAEISPSELFTSEIHPTLTTRCLPCHNSQTKKGALDLATREALLRGGDSGPAVMPGQSARQRALQAPPA